MGFKNELIEIRMRLLGARQMTQESETATKGVRGVGKAAQWTSRETAKTSRVTGGLTKGYGALGKAARYGLGFIGVGGIFALQQAVVNTEELSKTTFGLNRNLGLSNRVSSEWAAVAHARGIATTALNMGLTKMSKSFVDANRKGGTSRTALNQLGITQAQTEKGAHNFGYALDLVTKKFGAAHAGPQRQTAAMALLGKGYNSLLPLFSQGSKGLQEQLHWADKYGVTLDGKTNKSLMELVMAQRENKVAMLGLQLSLTKALMPAIKAGDDQLQQFIQTLNDPHLSAEQKVARISQQFLTLENDLFKVLDQALPHIAEQGGQFGIKLAGALWHGFIHSDLLGKLVIAGWLFKVMGGGGLIGAMGARVGGRLATSLGTTFLRTVAPYFAADVAAEGLGGAVSARMGGLVARFGGFGGALGTAFGVAMIAAAAAYVTIHQQDILDALGIDTNHGKLTGTSREMEATQLSQAGYKVAPFGMNGNVIHATSPAGNPTTWVKRGNHWVLKGSHPSHHHFHTPSNAGTGITSPKAGHIPFHAQHRRAVHPRTSRPQNRQQRRAQLSFSRAERSGDIVIQHTIVLDGKVVSESVTRHAQNDEALK